MALCSGVAAVLVSRDVAKRRAKGTSPPARPFRRSGLTGFDFALIGVIALTFAAVASTTISPKALALRTYEEDL
jgi:hypothetical protein